MLIPAMAFAWCVMSAESETASAARADSAMAAMAAMATAAKQNSLAPAAVVPAPLAEGESRSPIRTAIPPSVIDFAKTLVNLPMGAEHIESIDGQRYIFVLERHYHPPGFVGAPNGWHKGVTAYELKSSTASAPIASNVRSAD